MSLIDQLFKRFVVTGLIGLGFVSCEKHYDVDYGLGSYEERLADIRMIAGRPAFLLDDGRLLYNTGTNIPSDLKDSARVYLNYSILPDKTSGFDLTVRINGMRNIGFRELQSLDFTTISKIPDDPIFFESAWVGSHYLNMIFDIEYKSQPHKIYLVADSTKQNDECIPVYFRHDKSNDTEGYKSHVITSFDLEKFLGHPEESKTLLLHVNSAQYGNKTYEIKYK